MTTTTTKEDEEDESLYIRARRFYGHQSIRNTGLKKPGRLFKKRGTMPTFPTMSSILCNCPHYKLAGSNEAFKWGLQFLKEMSTFIFRDQCIFNEAWPSMFCQSLIQGLKRVICYVEKVSNLNSFFRRSKRRGLLLRLTTFYISFYVSTASRGVSYCRVLTHIVAMPTWLTRKAPRQTSFLKASSTRYEGSQWLEML